MILRSVLHHRPGDSCSLVGQGDRRHVVVTTLRNSGDPSTQPVVFAFGVLDDCARPVDQQGAQVCVAAFSDPQESFLAARAVLPWGQSEGSRHLPTIGKLPGIADRRHHSRGNHRPHAAQLL